MSADRVLHFAIDFSNGATGTISLDLARFEKNGLLQLKPCIIGVAPPSEAEVEVWMLGVVGEIISRTDKEALVIGASGVQWLLRAGQPPERTGRRFPPWFSGVDLPAMDAAAAAEIERRKSDGGLVE